MSCLVILYHNKGKSNLKTLAKQSQILSVKNCQFKQFLLDYYFYKEVKGKIPVSSLFVPIYTPFDSYNEFIIQLLHNIHSPGCRAFLIFNFRNTFWFSSAPSCIHDHTVLLEEERMCINCCLYLSEWFTEKNPPPLKSLFNLER